MLWLKYNDEDPNVAPKGVSVFSRKAFRILQTMKERNILERRGQAGKKMKGN